VKNISSTKVRGTEGEDRLYEMLTERLRAKDGYVVERVSGQSYSCDIAIKREKYPTIRLESKAHGLGTNEKVRYKEVEKFQRDLLQANNHGIFVSLYSGIVGIGNLEVHQLANGKFAVYLSNNHFDVDTIVDMLQLLYKLDSIVNSAKEDCGDLRVTVETMTRIKSYLQDYAKKINSIKAHMRDSISMLNEVQFDMIEAVLMGQSADKKRGGGRLSKGEHACKRCGKCFKTAKGCANHEGLNCSPIF
jgi:PIN domain nuclease of toxin-antitoxin system